MASRQLLKWWSRRCAARASALNARTALAVSLTSSRTWAKGWAECTVSGPGGEEMTLQLGFFERCRAPVAMEIGPVLDLEDVAGGKVCALASRVEPRDFADGARLMERYSPAELIGFARRLDPGLTARDFADAGRQLDRTDDEAFARYGMSPGEVATMREQFAGWPRTTEDADRELPGPAAWTTGNASAL